MVAIPGRRRWSGTHYACANSGKKVSVTEVTALTRARGITPVVDICQSIGGIPIDLQPWQADFAIGSCVKWLSGGPGAGFLWVDAEQLGHWEPIHVG
ncbi:MAG: aminotransferase class V-fold PLP-dependent enzyme [Pseudomonadales bacterium]